jgi:hypothetical protein
MYLHPCLAADHVKSERYVVFAVPSWRGGCNAQFSTVSQIHAVMHNKGTRLSNTAGDAQILEAAISEVATALGLGKGYVYY